MGLRLPSRSGPSPQIILLFHIFRFSNIRNLPNISNFLLSPWDVYVSLSNSATFRRRPSRVRIPHGLPQIVLIYFEFVRSDRPWIPISHFVPTCLSSISWTRAPAFSSAIFERTCNRIRPYHNILCLIAIRVNASQI